MSRVVKAIPGGMNAYQSNRGKYDWDLLLDGRIHELVPGEDFSCKPESVVTRAYEQARKRGVKVYGTIRDGKVYLLNLDGATERNARPQPKTRRRKTSGQ